VELEMSVRYQDTISATNPLIGPGRQDFILPIRKSDANHKATQ